MILSHPKAHSSASIVLLTVAMVLPGIFATTPSFRGTIASPAIKSSVCDTIAKFLPSFCSLDDSCMHVNCAYDLFGQNLDFGWDLNVCANPMSADVFLTDSNFNVTFSKAVAGQVSMMVPGLSFHVPDLGSAGVQLTASVGGVQSELGLSLQVAACATIGSNSTQRVDPSTGQLLMAKAGEPLGWGGCLPKPAITVLSGVYNFSWYPCSGEDSHAKLKDDYYFPPSTSL